MLSHTFTERRLLEQFVPDVLKRQQCLRLNLLLDDILPRNAFYQRKLAEIPRPLANIGDLQQWPLTTKDELIGEDGYATNRTFSLSCYARFHRTSGTKGSPLAVVDTVDDWQWWIDTWQFVLDAAAIQPDDRVFMAFSFGPFIGFWSAHDAVCARGAMSIPGGGLSTAARIHLIQSSEATVVCCTPTYALHLAEVARAEGVDLTKNHVRKLIVAGEPGGSIANVRAMIESEWNATLFDHTGATEVGPWGYADAERRGIHVNESEFIAEFLAVESGEPASEDELSELILTTLGRTGCPVIRYRTGDLVRPTWQADGENRFVLLDGGVLGRVDDMMIIRGVNVFPSSVENILRSFPEVAEYRLTVYKEGNMDAMSIEVEDRANDPDRIAAQLQLGLGLKVVVRSVPENSLPRFDSKGKRVVDRRIEEVP